MTYVKVNEKAAAIVDYEVALWWRQLRVRLVSLRFLKQSPQVSEVHIVRWQAALVNQCAIDAVVGKDLCWICRRAFSLHARSHQYAFFRRPHQQFFEWFRSYHSLTIGTQSKHGVLTAIIVRKVLT